MGSKSFSVPVCVVKGVGMPAMVWTVAEAYDFLNDWPASRRNGAHTLAVNACRAALSGDIEVDLAEEAFRGFARRHQILMDSGVLGNCPNSGQTAQRRSSMFQ
jgi:hypothetical protein